MTNSIYIPIAVEKEPCPKGAALWNKETWLKEVALPTEEEIKEAVGSYSKIKFERDAYLDGIEHTLNLLKQTK